MRTSTAWLLLACILACNACTNQTHADSGLRLSVRNAEIPIGPIPGPRVVRSDPPNPFQGDSTAARNGRRSYVQFNCYGCHGGHGGGGMGPSLRDADWIYGNSPAAIFDAIARGRANGMPSWSARLPESEIWQLVTYLQTLATSDEPEPPR